MNIDLLKEVEQGQEDWAFNIGVQAYIWGYPIVECWKDRQKKTREIINNIGKHDSTSNTINKFRHVRKLSTHESSEFVNAATDFLYSTAVVDLSNGPIKLNAGNFGDRWYGIQILDAYMETLANYGMRTVGQQIPSIILTNNSKRPDFADDVVVIESEINYIYIVVRIAVDPNNNLTEAHALQDSLSLRVLNASNEHTESAQPITIPESLEFDSGCPSSLAFFQELATVIKFVPPKEDEGMLLALLKEIGIDGENVFNYQSLSQGIKNGLSKAVPFANSILDRKLFEVGKNINGWGTLLDIGKYDKNYINRALVAKHGIWANVPEESIYFIARTDNQGGRLHGNNQYKITFQADSLPPVNAFWSISYYDESGRITKECNGKNAINPLHNKLQENPDGSISIFISKYPPEEKFVENWLPSHDGFFNLNFRCYNPQEEILNLSYQVPFIKLDTDNDLTLTEHKIAAGGFNG